MKIGEAMTKNVVMVDYSTKVREVCKIMGEKKIGSVVVSKEGKPFGIFTERDLLSRVLIAGNLDDEVGKYSSSPLIVVSPEYDIREAAKIMADMKIRRLLVMEDGEIRGIFTSSDLVRILGR
ncbi:MAG: CBS domain-containing protein [Archaeoglobaceae archaeon]